MCAAGGSKLSKAANKYQPDIILIDTGLSECSGIEAIQRIHERLPKTSIIVLTHSEASGEFLTTVRAGARAYG